jgi:hypothetical protein
MCLLLRITLPFRAQTHFLSRIRERVGAAPRKRTIFSIARRALLFLLNNSLFKIHDCLVNEHPEPTPLFSPSWRGAGAIPAGGSAPKDLRRESSLENKADSRWERAV